MTINTAEIQKIFGENLGIISDLVHISEKGTLLQISGGEGNSWFTGLLQSGEVNSLAIELIEARGHGLEFVSSLEAAASQCGIEEILVIGALSTAEPFWEKAGYTPTTSLPVTHKKIL